MTDSAVRHRRSHGWLKRLLDGAAVVAAILVAFALDAWWGERVERRQTEEMLAALESEWASELARIDETLVILDRSRRRRSRNRLRSRRRFTSWATWSCSRSCPGSPSPRAAAGRWRNTIPS